MLVIFPCDGGQAKVLVAGEYERCASLREQKGHAIGWNNRKARWKGSVIEGKRFSICDFDTVVSTTKLFST